MNTTFGFSDYISIISYIVVSIGIYGVFKKCEVKPYLAFVPVVRKYYLSICGDREREGRGYAIISGLYMVFRVLDVFTEGRVEDVIYIIWLILLLMRFVYMVRIYTGLVQVFEMEKAWIWMFVLFEGITMLIWGYMPGVNPSHKAILPGMKRAPKVGDYEAQTIEEGLTVNIKERSIWDFIKKKRLIKDVHLSIPKGHMVLLLGGSGAGKTTFVNAVTGYEKAQAQIKLGDRDMYKEYEGMKYDVGFVPQQDLMRGSDTVYNTLYDAALMKLPTNMGFFKKRKRVMEVLEEFGLYPVRMSHVSQLSGGQRKRLSIALEYISDPGLFILDEPDSGLDGVVARELFEKLRKIADQGKIVIVITHTPDRVINMFDEVVVLAKDSERTGRLAFHGTIDEAREFFGKEGMEGILASINQKDEGGEGLADEFIEKFNESREAG